MREYYWVHKARQYGACHTNSTVQTQYSVRQMYTNSTVQTQYSVRQMYTNSTVQTQYSVRQMYTNSTVQTQYSVRQMFTKSNVQTPYSVRQMCTNPTYELVQVSDKMYTNFNRTIFSTVSDNVAPTSHRYETPWPVVQDQNFGAPIPKRLRKLPGYPGVSEPTMLSPQFSHPGTKPHVNRWFSTQHGFPQTSTR